MAILEETVFLQDDVTQHRVVGCVAGGTSLDSATPPRKHKTIALPSRIDFA
jgi:hypothetical protein